VALPRACQRAIAGLIGRSVSTASREIARSGGRDAYRAAAAKYAAWDRGRRPKPSRLASNPALLDDVRGRLEEDWSPEQIAAWLRRERPTDPTRWVSHETIYRTIDLAGRRALGARAARRLRSGRSLRHPGRVRDSHGRGQLRNMVSIRAALVGSTLVRSPVVALCARLSRGDS
jgi:IS30 family transposase